MKEDYPGTNYIKGDNSRDMTI